MIDELPKAVQPLVTFASLLRVAGFNVSSEQTIGFLEGVRLVGPRSMASVRNVAYACFAPHFDQRGEFEALFRAHFEGDGEVVALQSDEEEFSVRDDSQDHGFTLGESSPGESGQAPSDDESLFVRGFDRACSAAQQRGLRDIAQSLPRRHGFRMQSSRRGKVFDISRSMSQMVATDGDLPNPALRDRSMRQRRVLLLIDISGSMKEQTSDYLRFAHIIRHAVDSIEIFTLGTRLTRITRALAHRREDVALARVADTVLDWDGGTRLGQAISTFIREPRYVNFARGAAVLILSDGLERDDPAELVSAVRRISHMAWRLSWATPLAADPRYRPATAALKALLPLLDDLIDGSALAPLSEFVLRLAKSGPSASEVWSQQRMAS